MWAVTHGLQKVSHGLTVNGHGRGTAPEGADDHFQAVGKSVVVLTWRAREGALEGGHVPELYTAVRA